MSSLLYMCIDCFTHVFIALYVYLLLCMLLYLFISLLVYWCIYICISFLIDVFIGLLMHYFMSWCIDLFVYLCVRVLMYGWIYVFVYLCKSTNVYLWFYGFMVLCNCVNPFLLSFPFIIDGYIHMSIFACSFRPHRQDAILSFHSSLCHITMRYKRVIVALLIHAQYTLLAHPATIRQIGISQYLRGLWFRRQPIKRVCYQHWWGRGVGQHYVTQLHSLQVKPRRVILSP